MPNLEDFLVLRKRYLNSAEVLFDFGHYDVAYYLAGYSVECAIKAVICKRIRPNEFPPPNVNSSHYVHDIKQLIKTAKLEDDLNYDMDRYSDLKMSFMVLKDWNPKDLRYESSSMSKGMAKNYIDEVKNEKGFVIWLNKYL